MVRLLFPRTPERLFAFFYKPSQFIKDDQPGSQITDNGGLALREDELKRCRGSPDLERDDNGDDDDDDDDEWKSEGWRVFSARAEFQRYSQISTIGLLLSPPPKDLLCDHPHSAPHTDRAFPTASGV
jgi:hypothetical protein